MSTPDVYAQLVATLQARWPENRVAPSLGRISALCHLLGEPQQACPVIAVAGTNGKGSTAILIEALLRSVGLRTGRFSSPHLMDVTERICIDGQPISHERFIEIWQQIEPYVHLVDEQAIDGVELTFFEVMTAMAYAAFADAPVDVAVMEVGLGGRWDSTNVADAAVAVVTPIDFDHMHILGTTLTQIAGEKAGIIKAGSQAVLAGQQPEAATVLMQRCVDVGAPALREGVDFGLLDRQLAVGGQLIRLMTADGPVGELHLPLFGQHMAHNAAQAVAAVEAFLGGSPLRPDVIQDAFDTVEAPARLEVMRTAPSVLLDTCHNPHGARATIEAVQEAFAFQPLVGVVAMMRDKDVDGVLRIFEEAMDVVVCTQVSSTARGLSADELAEIATGIFGESRVRTASRMDDALELAVALAEADEDGTPGVLVAGSVIAAGEARTLLHVPRTAPAPMPDEGLVSELWQRPDGEDGS